MLPTRLLHVKGLKTCRVEQVGLSVASLNGGDVFLLDDGSAVYLWSGREASVKEKQRGAEVAKGIKDERVHQVELLGEVVIHRLEQGQKSEDEHPEFWALLGGDKSMVRPAVADSAEDDAKGARESELFHLHESEDGKRALTIEKVKGGPLRAASTRTDTFVLVCPARDLRVDRVEGDRRRAEARDAQGAGVHHEPRHAGLDAGDARGPGRGAHPLQGQVPRLGEPLGGQDRRREDPAHQGHLVGHQHRAAAARGRAGGDRKAR